MTKNEAAAEIRLQADLLRENEDGGVVAAKLDALAAKLEQDAKRSSRAVPYYLSMV